MRYMHLSPRAKLEAINLLNAPVPAQGSGNRVAMGQEEGPPK
jgi:hypothetical protein